MVILYSNNFIFGIKEEFVFSVWVFELRDEIVVVGIFFVWFRVKVEIVVLGFIIY